MRPITALRASQGAAALAGIVMLWSAATAFRAPELAEGPARAGTAMSRATDAAPPVSDADVARTIAHDPFSVDRIAPLERYRIGATPGARPSVVAAPASEVRLVGTVIGGDGKSFAMCQVGQESSRIVYVGQRVGSLTLQSVAQGSAVFSDSTGKRTTLVVPKGGN